jgi:hypothetical protein
VEVSKTKLSKEGLRKFRYALNKFFASLRNDGYFVGRNFGCCQTCGWRGIYILEEPIAVFYHEKDTPHIEYGYVHLSWRGDGDKIAQTALEFGLCVKFEHETDNRIRLRWMDLEG